MFENNIFSININQMSKSELYRNAKTLTGDLGKDLVNVKSKWRGSTTDFWKKEVSELQKEISQRNKLYQTALKLSSDLRKPLNSPFAQGTDKRIWKNELQRLRMFRLRAKRREVVRQQERMKEVKSQIQQKQQKDRFRGVIDFFKNEGFLFKKDVKVEKMKSVVKTTTKFNIPENKSMKITPENLQKIKKQLLKIVNKQMARIGNKSFRIGVGDNRRNNKNYMSVAYQKGTANDVVNRLMHDHIRPYARGMDSDQDGEGFEINEVIIYDLLPNQQIIGNSTRTIAQANKTWYILSPLSKFNCLYQSLAICKNFKHNKKLLEMTEKGQDARVESGKFLKKKVKPKNDNYADHDSIQECANYLRYPIYLYNNVYQKIKTFKPSNPLKRYDGLKFYEIQVSGIHCNALVRKKDISKIHPNFEFPKKDEKVKSEKLDDFLIEKRKYFHKHNKKICSWDIETFKDENAKHIPYACSIAWFQYEYEKVDSLKWKCKKDKNGVKTFTQKTVKVKNEIGRELKEKQFWGLECLAEMTSFIFQNKKTFNKHTLYAHNGGKYDLPLVIEKSFINSPDFVIEGEGCLELNNAWIGFTLRAKHDRNFKLYFRDSFRLLPMGLGKLTKELKVEHQKLTETINHNEVNKNNFDNIPELKKYLTHDVFGLLEVLDVFGRGVYDDMGIDITKCFTGASLSKTNFFKNYYKPEKYGVYSMNDKNDKFIRDSYFGGRVECHKLGKIFKAYYYDFTSLYPDVGRNYLPYGEPEMIKINSDKLPKGFFGWVSCMIKTKNKKAIPKHGMLKDSRLIFPIFENWTSINLFSEELDFSIYDYKFIDGVKFKKAKFKKRFFNDGFHNKAKAKREGNPAMAQAYKIIINSGYGFWGLRTKDRDGVMICEPDSLMFQAFLENDKLLSIMEQKDYLFCRILKDLEVSDFNVAVASAISSYARSKLYSLISAIREKGGKVFYMDTDSVICDINLNDHLDIKERFQWDGDGSELGSLKNECDEVVEKLLKKLYPENKEKQKSIFKKLVEKENGNLSFDEGIITGCKQYALKKQVKIGDKIHNVEIVKLKGYSKNDKKINYNDMEKLNNGINIQQEQVQFSCPKSNYVSETKHFHIHSKKINKSFRRIYTKGQIFNDWVLPLRI